MDKMMILSQVREGRDLLSLPQALAQILREVDNPDFGSEQLARIILKDPPLTAKILKLANSSMYRRYSAVSNVHQAVQTLGAVTVKCLALSSSVFHPEQIKTDSGVDPAAIFRKRPDRGGGLREDRRSDRLSFGRRGLYRRSAS